MTISSSMECTQYSQQADYIQSHIYSKSTDIICITETWLYDSVLSTETFPHNYTIYRRDRGLRGGGIIIAISDNLTSKTVLCHTSLESIAESSISTFRLLHLITADLFTHTLQCSKHNLKSSKFLYSRGDYKRAWMIFCIKPAIPVNSSKYWTQMLHGMNSIAQ